MSGTEKVVLIVEDEEALASALELGCRRAGLRVECACSGGAGWARLQETAFDLLVLDIGLPDMSGLELFSRMREAGFSLPVLIITAHGNLNNAVQARRLGAAEYLVKPFGLEPFLAVVRKLLAVSAGKKPVSGSAPEGREASEEAALMIGGAPAMQQVYRQIANACVSDVPVMITGATGTGKTLCARAIHMNSARRDGPFVNLHCSTFPKDLLESELFGHEKNAFTGASMLRAGHVERAAGGTLLMDEIADIPLSTQAKLLRFVEERIFNRVGGREDRHVDLRLIAATNRDLLEEVRRGRFREDLYYRLQVLEIRLPLLMERLEDLPALCAYFLGRIPNGTAIRIREEAWELLRRYEWPGNVRQLKNVLERAAAVCTDFSIGPEHLHEDINGRRMAESVRSRLNQMLSNWLESRQDDGAPVPYDVLHDELEGMLLRHLLDRYDGRPTVMANELGINRVTLLKKRKRFGLE
ncbi:MAG: sigma-54 dependent transcriptional regulator [Kiritimatiellae bacterium]|nr:sigma-54 dependent transcriptional regulator [Kiritimatiellia bacterium]